MDRSELINLIEATQARILALVAMPSPALDTIVWTEDGTGEPWTAKDILAHIARWKRNGVEVARLALSRSETLLADSGVSRLLGLEVDSFNDEARQTDSAITPSDLKEQLTITHEALLAVISQLPDEQLIDERGRRFGWLRSATDHPAEHMEQIEGALGIQSAT